MYTKAYVGWLKAGMDAWSLGLESSAVVALRLTKLAGGGEEALREAELMVAEKVRAGIELHAELSINPLKLTALAGTKKALHHYRRKVTANRRRLSTSNEADRFSDAVSEAADRQHDNVVAWDKSRMIDLNTATAEQLDAVPQLRGHGFEIVRYRKERGGFGELRQLEEVPGLAGKWTGAEAEVSIG